MLFIAICRYIHGALGIFHQSIFALLTDSDRCVFKSPRFAHSTFGHGVGRGRSPGEEVRALRFRIEMVHT